MNFNILARVDSPLRFGNTERSVGQLTRFFSKFSATLLLTAVLVFFAKPAQADTTGFLSLINNYRAQNGAGALSDDQNLTNAACWLAVDLDKNGFSHTDSLGRSMGERLSDFGVNGSRAENIFYTTAGSSANLAFEAWKNSPGHNTNMLNNTYTRIGIGRALVNGRWYWATDFANGPATTLNNQCGVAVNSSPTPASPAPTPSTITKPSSKPASEKPSEVAAEPSKEPELAPEVNLTEATKAATLSSKIVSDISKKTPVTQESLVKGAALGSLLVGNLILLAFVFWKLLSHFHKILSLKRWLS